MKRAVAVAVFWCGVALAADGFLIRVDLGAGQTVRDVAQTGAVVVQDFGSWCLALAGEDVVAQLESGFRAEKLDENPRGKQFVTVVLEPGQDPEGIRRCGRVLTRDAGVVVVQASEVGKERLSRLGYDFAGVSLEPLVLERRSEVPRPLPVSDSLVRELVGRVSQDTLEARLRRMIGFGTRYSTHDSCRRAMAWMAERFREYGCDSVCLDTFRSGYAPNAIGVKRGRVRPGRIHVVCGHLDDYSEIPNTRAPGSEDNASGAGCVLEACRATQGVEFEETVVFIGFAGEEQGLVGSDTWVRRSRDRGDTIVTAMNFDMISYSLENRDTIRIHGLQGSAPCESLVDFFRAQADTFTSLATKKYMTTAGQAASDHRSFWNYGYLAIRGGYLDRTPVYHTTGDTIGPLHYEYCGTNNLPLYTEVVRATVATLAKWAGAYYPVGIAEHAAPRGRLRETTVVRRVLSLQSTISNLESKLVLVDAGGRSVMVLRPGLNDLRRLGAGVYFVLSGNQAGPRVVLVE